MVDFGSPHPSQAFESKRETGGARDLFGMQQANVKIVV